MVSTKAHSASASASKGGQGRVAHTTQSTRANETMAIACVRKRPAQLSSVSVSALAITPSSTGINCHDQSRCQPSPNTTLSANKARTPCMTPSC